ncbi:MAG: PLDc N-terminal domain-containing protein [Candidatus Omnitrophica bacterium]|nr:PLDc N-terminal domain-containing protein [Candidatus Omnitrophota bacterium]
MPIIAGIPVIVIILLMALFPLLWLLTLISALSAKNEDPVEKLTWVLVIILLPVIGAIIYWILKGGVVARIIFLTLLIAMLFYISFWLCVTLL